MLFYNPNFKQLGFFYDFNFDILEKPNQIPEQITTYINFGKKQKRTMVELRFGLVATKKELLFLELL